MVARAQGFEPGEVNVERFLNLRYQGTDVAVMTSRPPDGDYAAAFAQVRAPPPPRAATCLPVSTRDQLELN